MGENIVMPKFNDDASSGILARWLKQEGDPVKTGEAVAEIETDKATLEIESQSDGVLLQHFVAAGTKVPVDAPLCAIGQPGEQVRSAPKQEIRSPSTAPVEREITPAVALQPVTLSTAHPVSDGRLRISPAARHLAQAQGIDPAGLPGSGPKSRIVRKDILAAALTPRAAVQQIALEPEVRVTERLVPNSTMRTTIARRLVEAKTQIPHFYLEIEIDAGPMLDLRRQLNHDLESAGIKCSVNDFVLKASALALKAVPEVNSSWEGNVIKYHGDTHVSFAVTIDDGLITPVIRHTDRKSLPEISRESKVLAAQARNRKLQPAQFTGGTFCVSNLGMMGVHRFCAIINPPNAAILAVGAIVQKPVVANNQIAIGECLALTLSCDHRVVDGHLGARFLGAIREALEHPLRLLVTLPA